MTVNSADIVATFFSDIVRATLTDPDVAPIAKMYRLDEDVPYIATTLGSGATAKFLSFTEPSYLHVLSPTPLAAILCNANSVDPVLLQCAGDSALIGLALFGRAPHMFSREVLAEQVRFLYDKAAVRHPDASLRSVLESVALNMEGWVQVLPHTKAHISRIIT